MTDGVSPLTAASKTRLPPGATVAFPVGETRVTVNPPVVAAVTVRESVAVSPLLSVTVKVTT